LRIDKQLVEQLKRTHVIPGGAAGAVSKVTGALGKGIATMTMDDEYQKKRLEAKNKQPADVTEGLARGGKGLVMVGLVRHCKLGCITACLFAPSTHLPTSANTFFVCCRAQTVSFGRFDGAKLFLAKR